MNTQTSKTKIYSVVLIILLSMVNGGITLFAQNLSKAKTALEGTANQVKSSIISPVITIVYIVIGLAGIIKAIMVYNETQKQNGNAVQAAAGWLGGTLVVVGGIYLVQQIFLV